MKSSVLLRFLFAALFSILVGACSAAPEEDDGGSEDGGGADAVAAISISYPTLQHYYEMDTAIPDVPVSSDVDDLSKLSDFKVSPNLPGGLFLDSATGKISGTPVGEWMPEEFTITAQGPAGPASTRVTFGVHQVGMTEVDPASTTPRNFSYDRVILNAFAQENIQPNTPKYFGPATSFHATLPYPMTIDASTGVIAGAPQYAGDMDVPVELRDNGRSFYTVVKIKVEEPPIVNPRYNISRPVIARGDYFQIWLLYDRGEFSVTSCSISPTLPAGLTFNTTNCIIDGAANSDMAATTYRVTSTNPVGSVSTDLVLEIADRAPEGLVYTKNFPRYVRNYAIATNAPTLSYSGGVATSYSVSPALPPGLSLNTATGVITGTPTTLQAAADYVVSAINDTGTSQRTLSIAVVNPGTSTLYTADGAEIKAYSVDDVNGDPTHLGKTISSNVNSRLVFHPTHDCAVGYSGSAVESFSINKSTNGDLTKVSSIGGVSNPAAIVQTANGNFFFVANSGFVSAYSLDSSCTATFVGNVNAAGTPKEMVISGDHIYILNSGAGIQHFRHGGSGVLTLTSSIGMQAHANPPSRDPALGNGLSLAISSNGGHVYAFDTLKAIETFSASATTGILTSVNVSVHNDRWYFRRPFVVGDYIIHPFQAFNDGLASLKMQSGYAEVTELREGSSAVGQGFAGATGVIGHTSPSGTYLYASYANMAGWGARRLKFDTMTGLMTPLDPGLQFVVGGY